jgi:branched-chain amino acid transport system permease protein
MEYLSTIIILGGISIIATLGLAILTGYTGLFSIGHSGFMALGGYMTAILYLNLHVPFAIALILGGLFAGLGSLVIGYPSFRSQLKGDYFAIATYGFAEAIRLILNTTYKAIGGAYGLTGIPMLTNLPIMLVAIVLALFLAHAFVTSQYGKNCIAVKEDAVAAQMMGVSVLKTQLIALFVSAFYAGVAGGLFAFYMAYLSPSMFTLTRSSDLLAAVVFGGMQSLIGPAIAAFFLVGVPELLRMFTDWRLIVYGLLFVTIIIFRPQGLLGYREMNFDAVKHFFSNLLAKKKRLPKPDGTKAA